MLTKRAKVVNDLHNEYFYLERKINSEIGKLQKRARNDFKRFARQKNRKIKIKFSSLRDEAYTKEWEPKIYVEYIWGFENSIEFSKFCLEASEKIGLEFVPICRQS